jgi:hypothetical protein
LVLLRSVTRKLSVSLCVFIAALFNNCHFGTASKPSIAACKTQIGSISVTVTIDPAPLKEAAVPFPTSPYPHTTTLFYQQA